MGGWSSQKIIPLRGPILQAEACQRFSAELRFQDRAECGNIELISKLNLYLKGIQGFPWRFQDGGGGDSLKCCRFTENVYANV